MLISDYLSSNKRIFIFICSCICFCFCFVFYLTHLREPVEQKYKSIFEVQMKTLKFASEIYWPLEFIFLSIYNFDNFHAFELRWLAISCLWNPKTNSETPKILIFLKSFTCLVIYYLLLLFLKITISFVQKNCENLNMTSEKCWTHCVMPHKGLNSQKRFTKLPLGIIIII